MAISGVSATSGTNQAAYGLDFQSLLKIILTQLTYQDPLKPVDNFEFVSQLAQFSQLQQSQTLNDKIDNLLASQAATQGTSLLGRTVDVQTTGGVMTGVVKAVGFNDKGPTISIQPATGQLVAGFSIADVQNIR